jgi:hypothetical protein
MSIRRIIAAGVGFLSRRANVVAEREGFEPPLGCPKPDFESGAFDHSAISPCVGIISQRNVHS